MKALLTTITSLHCEVHEASLLLSVRACFHIHLISKNNVNKTTAKAALTQMLSVVYQRMEMNDKRRGEYLDESECPSKAEEAKPAVGDSGADDAKDESVALEKAVEPKSASAAGNGNNSQPINNLIFPSVYHKDAYLLFRALCKLSMKGLSEDSQWSQTDAIPLQNK